MDGDGDLDAFVANAYGQPNRVWLNDGSGDFHRQRPDAWEVPPAGRGLGDVDGDGDLDAFVANYNQAEPGVAERRQRELSPTAARCPGKFR